MDSNGSNQWTVMIILLFINAAIRTISSSIPTKTQILKITFPHSPRGIMPSPVCNSFIQLRRFVDSKSNHLQNDQVPKLKMDQIGKNGGCQIMTSSIPRTMITKSTLLIPFLQTVPRAMSAIIGTGMHSHFSIMTNSKTALVIT